MLVITIQLILTHLIRPGLILERIIVKIKQSRTIFITPLVTDTDVYYSDVANS